MKENNKLRSKNKPLKAESNSTSKRPRRKLNKQILLVAYVFVALFLALIGYIGKYMIVDSQDDIVSAYNKRQDIFKDKVIKGKIKSSDGVTLVKSVKSSDESDDYERTYVKDDVFAQVLGYDINGKDGIEASANYYLYTSHANPIERIFKSLKNEKNIGDTVITTLDSELQQAAYDALGSQRGAVVAMEPSTGKILAMVSKPDYNPNNVAKNWEDLTKDEDSPLLNRASQGLYPPGSTFKLLTALEYMRENKDYSDYSYNCKGTMVASGVKIKCSGYTAHGKVDLTKSLAKSCNCSFVNMAMNLNFSKFNDLCQSFGYNKSLNTPFHSSKSRFELNENSNKSEMPQTSIGQGNTLISPLHNCMIASTVANNGVMVTPYVVDSIESYTGSHVKSFSSPGEKRVISEKEASKLKKMMEKVVEEGTASSLSGLQHSYAGKTGSAENDDGDPHGWFVGFSPVKDPQIAICVIVENGGSGSGAAVPIAKQVFTTYYSKKLG